MSPEEIEHSLKQRCFYCEGTGTRVLNHVPESFCGACAGTGLEEFNSLVDNTQWSEQYKYSKTLYFAGKAPPYNLYDS